MRLAIALGVRKSAGAESHIRRLSNDGGSRQRQQAAKGAQAAQEPLRSWVAFLLHQYT